jgi:hypothetical protein
VQEEHAASGSKKDFSKVLQCAAKDAVGHSEARASKLDNLERQCLGEGWRFGRLLREMAKAVADTRIWID